jgi:hypothetical protein
VSAKKTRVNQQQTTKAKPKPTVKTKTHAADGSTPQKAISRTSHLHRSQAHTSAVGRRRQARRDMK